MRVALISDIHANLAALEAVLRDIESQKVEAIHCLGDVVGYGPDPSECVELVSRNCATKLLGNHEYAVLGLDSTDGMNNAARKSAEWTIEQLGDREISIIADFEMVHIFSEYTLVHASPCDPENWPYLLTLGEAALGFEAMSTRFGFFGHTHVPMVFTCDEEETIRQKMGHDVEAVDDCRYLINIGSVGQPRDDDPRACYVVLETESETISYRRVDYDIERTQRKMQEVKLPKMLIDRLAFGR